MLHHEVYKLNDSNDWIVMLHGLGGNSRIWYKQKRELIKKFNVIFVDLHGHGKSKMPVEEFKHHSFEDICKDILEVLDLNNIKKAAFMGVSLGTIIARTMLKVAPERVRFMVLAGAVLTFNFRCKFLLELGNLTKHILPYMVLYRLFAVIMMPRKHHTKARSIFVKEAMKLGRKEFLFWYGLARKIGILNRSIKKLNTKIPTLYVMGSEDYMFISSIRKEVDEEVDSKLHVIEKSGHLCNLEKPEEFNPVVIQYIEKQFNS